MFIRPVKFNEQISFVLFNCADGLNIVKTTIPTVGLQKNNDLEFCPLENSIISGLIGINALNEVVYANWLVESQNVYKHDLIKISFTVNIM